jgi:hypothetical protein
MRRAITGEERALLKEAGEMFNETGCVPGSDGEQVPAERIVPDAKEYILEVIDDPEIRDMGYTWIYISAFLASAKMASKMWQARGSPQ